MNRSRIILSEKQEQQRTALLLGGCVICGASTIGKTCEAHVRNIHVRNMSSAGLRRLDSVGFR